MHFLGSARSLYHPLGWVENQPFVLQMQLGAMTRSLQALDAILKVRENAFELCLAKCTYTCEAERAHLSSRAGADALMLTEFLVRTVDAPDGSALAELDLHAAEELHVGACAFWTNCAET